MKVSDMSAQAPVGTTLALLERQLKVMSAVQARVHFSLKQELNLLAAIIRDFTDDEYSYEPDGEEGPRAKKSDYSHVDIIPVSDPNAATLSQRVVQYQAVIQMAQMAPDIYNLPELHRGMLDVLGIKNADKLVPLPEDLKPMDPVSENMAVLKMEPVKAFRNQDHDAHIKVHMGMMQDPMVMQLIGQNPKAPQMQAAMADHIAEHVAMAYRQKIEQQLGMSLPDSDANIPPEVERPLSAMLAQAAQQVLTASQQQAAQMQAQQAQQDPIVQMQQQELQIKMQEVQLKAKKVDLDAQIAMERARLEAQQALQRMQLEERKLALTAAGQADKLEIERGKVEAETVRHQDDNIARRAERVLAHSRDLAKNKQSKPKE